MKIGLFLLKRKDEWAAGFGEGIFVCDQLNSEEEIKGKLRK